MKDDYHTIFSAYENGVITWSSKKYRCAIGKSGVIASIDKREGDNKSPLGDWPIRRVFYRADRVEKPDTKLEVIQLNDQMGWCDDPNDPENYNTLVTLPYSLSHEKLWREDHVYDIIVELGYNDSPPVIGLGSAIFMHVKRNDYEGTDGCVALSIEHLREVLHHAKPGDIVRISSA